LVTGRDLRELFRESHRLLVGIIDTCETRALQDPRDESEGVRISAQRTVQLERLLVYKTVWTSLNATAPTTSGDAMLDELARIETIPCTTEDTDPRSIPFLPFDLGAKRHADLQLNTRDGRDAFESEFGPARSRKDAEVVGWRLDPRAYHGTETLRLRGGTLPKGFHWDVQVERGSILLKMATEVWKIKRGQYLNVYPDLHVRTTQDGGRKLWP
jgi:hypothetical protein